MALSRLSDISWALLHLLVQPYHSSYLQSNLEHPPSIFIPVDRSNFQLCEYLENRTLKSVPLQIRWSITLWRKDKKMEKGNTTKLEEPITVASSPHDWKKLKGPKIWHKASFMKRCWNDIDIQQLIQSFFQQACFFHQGLDRPKDVVHLSQLSKRWKKTHCGACSLK